MKRAISLLLIFCPSALVADQAKQKTVAKFPREIKGDRAHYPGRGAFCPGSLSRKVPCPLWFSSVARSCAYRSLGSRLRCGLPGATGRRRPGSVIDKDMYDFAFHSIPSSSRR
jgi:hypothetical protein